MEMRIVIPSRKRPAECARALKLFPEATVTVAESEVPAYQHLRCELVPHADEVAGIGPIRQWVLDNFEEEVIVMVDDDIVHVRCPVGHVSKSHVIIDAAAIRQILINSAQIAKDMGTAVFGFDQSGGDTRKFRVHDPFGLNSWTGGVIGIVGRSLRYDTSLLLRADIDYCLKCLLKHRIVFIDRRFSFVHKRFTNSGGNDHVRSAQRSQAEIDRLKDRWGPWLGVEEAKTTIKIKVKVRRRQTGRGQTDG